MQPHIGEAAFRMPQAAGATSYTGFFCHARSCGGACAALGRAAKGWWLNDGRHAYL
ncbi:MAG: hypothetical protein ACRD4K_02260 [Candidatus Acidiferrales bacterium]